MALVKVEGTELELDDSICKTDKSLKDALLPFYPAVANADVKREQKGDKTVITVTKRAGSKGARGPMIESLDAAQEWIHPALALSVSDPRKVKGADVDKALEEAMEAESQMARAARVLDEAAHVSSNTLPQGF